MTTPRTTALPSTVMAIKRLPSISKRKTWLSLVAVSLLAAFALGKTLVWNDEKTFWASFLEEHLQAPETSNDDKSRPTSWSAQSFVTFPHWDQPPVVPDHLSLPELAGSLEEITDEECTPPLMRFNDTIVSSLSPHGGNDATTNVSLPPRQIPRIIHFTSKSRCLTEPFIRNLQKWQFPHHDVYLHDDAAVERLLQRHWPQFPHLQMASTCLLSGAAKADLWRAVILYEYGGIYSDIDNAPNRFHAEDSLQTTDEAFFVVESVGVLSQWFMATKPKHPLMYLLVQTILQMLLKLPDVDKQYVPSTTGPGALKIAMMHFMDAVQYSSEEHKAHMSPMERWQKVERGTYTGLQNSTVRVVGKRSNENAWVRRNCLSKIDKTSGYKDMGMKHFSAVHPASNQESCLFRLYRQYERDERERRENESAQAMQE